MLTAIGMFDFRSTEFSVESTSLLARLVASEVWPAAKSDWTFRASAFFLWIKYAINDPVSNSSSKTVYLALSQPMAVV